MKEHVVDKTNHNLELSQIWISTIIMDDSAASSSVAAAPDNVWGPVDVLSDDDGNPCQADAPPPNPPRPLRPGCSSKRQLMTGRLRQYFSNLCQSSCFCNRKRRGQGRQNCFQQFADSIEELIKLRSEIDKLHKQDSDDKARHCLALWIFCRCQIVVSI